MEARLKHLLHEIISSRKTVFYKNQRYILTNPSLDIILEADLVYTQHYDNHLYDDRFLHAENITNDLIRYGIFFPANEEEIKTKNKELDNFKKTLFRQYKDIKNRNKSRTQIKFLKESLNKLYNLKHYLDFLTLEKYCENLRHEYIIAHTLYSHDTNELVFDYANLQNVDPDFFNGIIDTISNSLIELSTLKQIVISEYWKNIYTNNTHNIFPHPAVEYTEEQKSLINLSKMYDSIYQHPDCPDDDIIADEDALDGWMLVQKDKIKKQKTESGVRSRMSSKIANSDHVFIPTSEAPDEIQDIIALSSPETGGPNGLKRLNTLSKRN